MMEDHESQIASDILGNRLHSAVLILVMVALFLVMGYFLAGTTGAIIALIIGTLAATVGPRVSPMLILRMYKASPISAVQAPELDALFSELVRRSGLKTPPQLYYVPSRLPNAFAVGTQSEAAVGVTDGILRVLNGRELAGVLAHELSHIRHNDIRVMGIADVMSRLTATASQIGQFMLFFAVPMFLSRGSGTFLLGVLLLVVAPIGSNLLQLALSRRREFNADLGAVGLTGDAIGLASALKKIERMIPTGGFGSVLRRSPQSAMLRTHPPTDERVRRLLEFAPEVAEPVRPQFSPTGRIVIGAPRVRRGPRWHVAGLWF